MFFDILVFYCMVPDPSDKEESRPLMQRDDRYHEMEDYHPGWAGHRRYQGQPAAYGTPRREARRPTPNYENDMDEADDIEIDERTMRGPSQQRSRSRVYDTGLSGTMADLRRPRTSMKASTPARATPGRATPHRGTPNKTLGMTSRLKPKGPTTPVNIHRPVENGIGGGFVGVPQEPQSPSNLVSRPPSAIRGGGASDEPRGRDRRVKDVGTKYGGEEDEGEDEVDDLMRRYAGANFK